MKNRRLGAILGSIVACGGESEPATDDTTSTTMSTDATSDPGATGADTPGSTGESDTTAFADDGGTDTGPGPTPVRYDTPFAAGTRLHARALVAEDGPAALIGWYDTALEIACSAGFDREGSMRCLPDATPGYAASGSTRWVYLDAACTQPALELHNGEPPSWVRVEVEDPSRCATERPAHEVYRLGETMSPPAIVYDLSGSDCVADVPVEGSLYAVELAEPGDLVAMTRVVDGPPGRYTRDVRVGDDGSHQWWSIYDRDLDEACAMAEIYGEWTCLSRDRTAPFAVRLGSCGGQEGALAHGDPACGPPDLLREDTNQGTVTVYGIGDEVDPRDARVEVGGRCIALSEAPPPWSTLRPYLRGAVLTGADLPPLSTVVPGDTRLRRHHWADEDATPLFAAPPLGWYDAELGNDCVPIPLARGERVCVGAMIDLGPDAFGWFADAACSQPLVDDGLGLAARGPAIVIGRPAGEPDPSAALAWMVGEPFVGPAFVQLGGSCTPTEDTGLYVLGEPVDLDQVPRLFVETIGT